MEQGKKEKSQLPPGIGAKPCPLVILFHATL